MGRHFSLIQIIICLCLLLAGTVESSAAEDPLGQLSRSIKTLGLNLFQDELLPADQAFHFSAETDGPEKIKLHWQIADGYYLYRNQFKIEKIQGEAKLGTPRFPPGKQKDDPEFGTTEVYFHSVTATVPLQRLQTQSGSLTLRVGFQGCAERGVCYPPMQKTITLTLPPITAATQSTAVSPPPTETLAEQDRIARVMKDQSFWWIILIFLGFGIGLSFTPCVFPMLPILSGIIVGQGRSITTARAFTLSLSYVIASALMYTVFGVLAGLFGANLQAAFQNPWIIGTFSAVFVLLALAMFGLYQLQMPSSWQSRLANWRGGKRGGIVNAAVMGALSALIVGPCVAAPLAGALIYIGQTGDAVLGGAALFAMGLGMGLPLIAIGTSAGKLLPRAGLWMNTIRAIFGVILLGVAIWLLERILPPTVTMVLWALWLIGPAIYLGATSPLPEEASHWRRLGKGLGIVMLTYGILLLIGVSAGSRDVLQPLKILSARSGSQNPPQVQFQRLTSLPQLEQKMAVAKNQGQWVMLDFYADWCISCKELENGTFAHPQVQQALRPLLTLQADVTANTLPEKALLKRFGLIGPPAVLFFTPQGQECPSARLIGFIPPERFLEHLRNLPQKCA